MAALAASAAAAAGFPSSLAEVGGPSGTPVRAGPGPASVPAVAAAVGSDDDDDAFLVVDQAGGGGAVAPEPEPEPPEAADPPGGGGGVAAAEADGGITLTAAEEESGVLTEEQLGLLLQDEGVQRAMAEIAADPEAVVRYQDDPVVMGVIHSLNAQA